MREGHDYKGVQYIEKLLPATAKNITGKQNGRLTACFPVDLPNKDLTSEGVYWLCECECGNKVVVNGRRLKPGSYESCGCLTKDLQLNLRAKNLVGQTFGRLTVLERDFSKENEEFRKAKVVYWRCQCACGNIVSIRSDCLLSRNTTSCGCYARERSREANSISNLTNRVFGYLTALEQVVIDGVIKWKCQCKCGNITYVIASSLLNYHTQSCGCLRLEKLKEKVIDLTGQRFGYVEVLERAETEGPHIMWKCKCDCGRVFTTRGTDLRYKQIRSCGCIQSIGQQTITRLLIDNNVPFKAEQRFETCRNPKTNAQLIFDFYINNSFLLEYDGIQHYQSSTGWNTQEHYNILKEHDELKNQWCKDNNIPLKRVPYWKLKELTIDNIMDDTFLLK